MGDDIPFPVVGGTAARLFQPDLNLMERTQKPQVLLSHDGTRPKQIVCSVRPPSGGVAAGLRATQCLLSVTAHAWLGANALRSTSSYAQTKDDLTGIDFTFTAVTSGGNVPGVTKPLLIVANSGHYFLRPDEILIDAAKMTDKTIGLEEGSVHGGTECSLHFIAPPTGRYGAPVSGRLQQ